MTCSENCVRSYFYSLSTDEITRGDKEQRIKLEGGGVRLRELPLPDV